ncbi:MAG: ribulose-phosphate 3-epimerase [Planctomycetes bacterium]|jgi:ribulose-phosphate 3-epimerase|nr:ribulose-phosphate 3-epimerase [Planctomycetota bacterium]
MHSTIKIAPSLLAADFCRLDREIESVEAAGADLLHVDVMDGHFVPNITIGPFIVEAIKRIATLPLDVHLMIAEPARYVETFIDAGANSIDFHIEVAPEPAALIETIRGHGLKAGIVISPDTPVEAIIGALDAADQVTVMTVYPGFGGQELIPECVEKARRIAHVAPNVDLLVDGGINAATIPTAAAAGANVFVAGSAIFGKENRSEAINCLRRLAQEAHERRTQHSRRR